MRIIINKSKRPRREISEKDRNVIYICLNFVLPLAVGLLETNSTGNKSKSFKTRGVPRILQQRRSKSLLFAGKNT